MRIDYSAAAECGKRVSGIAATITSCISAVLRVRPDLLDTARWRHSNAVLGHQPDMCGKRLGGIYDSFIERVTGRGAARKIREIGRIILWSGFDEGDVVRHGGSISSKWQARLPTDRMLGLDVQIFARVRHGNFTRFRSMLELVMRTLDRNQVPSIGFQLRVISRLEVMGV